MDVVMETCKTRGSVNIEHGTREARNYTETWPQIADFALEN
jgi:hypothetical protein